MQMKKIYCLFVLSFLIFVFLSTLKISVYVKSQVVAGWESVSPSSKTIYIENISFPVELNLLEEEKNKQYIHKFLEFLGESQEDVLIWDKIIKKESKYNPQSKAPTYWSLCDQPISLKLWGLQQPMNRFIELRDYENGIWQATCEEFGATTIEYGYSQGLTHIIQPTWDSTQCSGFVNDWRDQLICSIKIRDLYGWEAWSTF